jgi:OMF family outer membrane factor
MVCCASPALSQSPRPAGSAARSTDLNLDFLDPDPNPLLFPSQPQEIEIKTTQPITLQQAVDLAVRNNLDIQSSQRDLERYQAALREAQATNLPTLDASASYTHSATQQSSTVTSSSNVLSGTVEANYSLFTSGQRNATIRAAAAQVEYQQLQVEVETETVTKNVISDYYDLQQSDQQVRIYQDSVTQNEQSLRDAEALQKAGVGTRYDVLQSQVNLANARQNLIDQISQQQIARRTLRQILNVAQSVTVTAVEPVVVASSWNLSLEDSIIMAFQNRAELQQQLVEREISQLQRRANLAKLGPQVSLFASIGLNNTLDRSTGFLYNYQMGTRVSMNLFDGGADRAKADQNAAQIASAETNFANSRNQIRLEVEQAYLGLQANSEKIKTSSVAVEKAVEALRLARLRFQSGVGTQSDVLTSQTDLTTAQVNYLKAVIGYNRSLASLKRAVSKFSG